MTPIKKVLVLMSGGVDSSTAAALLVREGYEVAGVYLKLWQGTGNKEQETIGDPCWAVEMKDAARVAAKLGIPFTVWDVTEDYKIRVLENFYDEYGAGRTPNPDVLCNSEIKFGIALDRALKLGYDFIATGHYARVRNPSQPPLTLRGGDDRDPPLKVRGGEGELCQLYAAVDKKKDQSYFLWRLTQEQLAHTMFPIGEYTKPQVRQMAKEFGLHNAGKKDSQGVCFLGKIDLKEFLQPTVSEMPGPIHDVRGNLMGMHDGLAHFTIGQRHGTKLGGTGPYFVVEKDAASNTLIVANEEDEPAYRAVRCQVSGVRCLPAGKAGQVKIPEDSLRCMARVRYRAPLLDITIQGNNVVFDEPARAVAPGQSIVFYDGDKVIGGGIIDTTTLLCKVQRFAHVS